MLKFVEGDEAKSIRLDNLKINYEKGVKVNGKKCKQSWDNKTLKNGHWIVFSECSWPHQKLVLEFIRESLVNDKILTVDSKISRK